MPQAKLQRLNPIARQYEAATDRQVAMENAAGINTLSRHGLRYARSGSGKRVWFLQQCLGLKELAACRDIRTHDTFAELYIAAGIDPKSLNAVTLLAQRVARGQQPALSIIACGVESLRATTDPQTGKSIVTNPEIIANAAPDCRLIFGHPGITSPRLLAADPLPSSSPMPVCFGR